MSDCLRSTNKRHGFFPVMAKGWRRLLGRTEWVCLFCGQPMAGDS